MTPIDINQFVGTWRITSVGPGFQSFVIGSPLSIEIADAASTKCNFSYAGTQEWRITEIPLVGDALEQDPIDVWSPQDELLYPRHVKLSLLENGHLEGHVSPKSHPAHRLLYGDGPVGTFIAEAGSGEKAVDAPRLEESIAV
jgi:hypothetical protein